MSDHNLLIFVSVKFMKIFLPIKKSPFPCGFFRIDILQEPKMNFQRCLLLYDTRTKKFWTHLGVPSTSLCFQSLINLLTGHENIKNISIMLISERRP